jgi:two-component system chemotaxis response regulator CheB
VSAAIKVLVVDDSPFACRAIKRMLGLDPRIEVVGQAHDGTEALRLLATLPVDVVTLDLEMPGMGGLATLERLRGQHGVPVVVLSGAAAESASVTMRALEMGALDVVAKPVGGPLALHGAAQELVDKVRAAAGLGADAAPAPLAPPAASPVPAGGRGAYVLDLIVIATSTGGPAALQAVLPALPADFPVPLLVLQHMPPGYTTALAERLDRMCALAVREAVEGDRLVPGTVLVAPAGRQLALVRRADGPAVALRADCPIASFYRPCIDFTLGEAARELGVHALAVILTGMGSDGAAGCCQLAAAGGAVWAQDEATSTIYGMPRAAVETGVVEEVLALPDVARRLVAVARRPAARPRARG